MLFNSIDFAIFLPIVFVLYWFVTNHNLKLQNLLLVVASYLFYGWWDWRFLSLIFLSSIIDYTVSILLDKEGRVLQRKILLGISIGMNLGLLGFFKYYNFFLDNFIAAFTFFGQEFQSNSLKIVLPVGISFYTFQTMSYTIDVYRRQLKSTKDFIAFSGFVSFFPQLVAGPIERATNLLPQFYKKRTFDYALAANGMRQILWGFFKKVVIADNCAQVANMVFNNSEQYSGFTLFIGVLFFAFQIYGDFSGYSDIAIGLSKLFGFSLMQNFAFPYFSRDIAEFWRRWHISLSTWFRDYLYIPLGGSQGNLPKKIRNTLVIFIVSGFWHGANWTFLIWGALNAIYFLPLLIFRKNRSNIDIVAKDSIFPSFKSFFQMLFTFGLTLLAWIFFRATDVGHAVMYIKDMILGLFLKQSYVETINLFHWEIGYALPVLLLLFILTEWAGRRNKFAIEFFFLNNKRWIRWSFYALLISCIALFMNVEKTPFIYFQF